VREIGDGGAILVRPDAHVAFRSMVPVDDATSVLRDVRAVILGAPVLR
jgi:hypothetical protein